MLLNCGVGKLLRVPWIARRSKQSILKEIKTECALEGLMLKLKLQYFGRLMRRTDSLEKTSAREIVVVQLLSHVQLCVTPRTAACQASLSITSSWSLLKLMSIKLVMPSNHLILCRPLLPPSVFPSIRVFSNESVLHISWPKYWSFSFSISPSNDYSGLISFRMD